MDKTTKIWKGVEGHTIAVGVEARVEACGKTPKEKGVIHTGKKVYRPPLPSTCKEMELLEDLNDGIEWVFIDYRISLKQGKDPHHQGTTWWNLM